MLSLERVLGALSYNPETGVFSWRCASRNTKVGAEAGHIDDEGYRLIGLDGRVYRAHRLAWLVVHGQWPSKVIDHINGNRLDNRAANLRDVSISENHQNQANPKCANPYLGVSWQESRKKWRADICVGRVQRTIGRFDTKEAARDAYLEAKRQLHIPGRLIWPDLKPPKTKK